MTLAETLRQRCLLSVSLCRVSSRKNLKGGGGGGAKVEFILFRGGDYRANQITDWY